MRAQDLQVGIGVRYHPIIGGKHDGNLYTVRHVGSIPSSTTPVAWLEGKSGCVCIEALSLPQPGQDNYGLPR